MYMSCLLRQMCDRALHFQISSTVKHMSFVKNAMQMILFFCGSRNVIILYSLLASIMVKACTRITAGTTFAMGTIRCCYIMSLFATGVSRVAGVVVGFFFLYCFSHSLRGEFGGSFSCLCGFLSKVIGNIKRKAKRKRYIGVDGS